MNGTLNSGNIFAKELQPCPEGQERNPETNRCRKIPIGNTQNECKEGYERNEETGRCKKIKQPKINDGASHPLLERVDNGEKIFTASAAVIAVLATGVIYVIFQFKNEIRKIFRKIIKKLL